MMGQAILRQVRVRANTCLVPESASNVTRECAGLVDDDEDFEESGDFCDGWRERNRLTSPLPSCQRKGNNGL